MKIDLITGFLGAGKTTWIRRYARYLIDKGENICILENDYGAINVDMMFLQDLLGDHCELEMVIGGDGYEAHRRRFKTKLISMAMMGYDRVIVEPSGVFDVDEFFDVLREEPLDRWYEPGNVIAVVDAHMGGEISEESRYLLASQIANAGCVILSKVQMAGEDEISGTVSLMNDVMRQFQCSRRFGEDVLAADWDQLTETDFEKIMRCDAVKDLFADPACGTIHRIKGFVRMDNGEWIQINAVRDKIEFAKRNSGQEAVIVIGEDLHKEAVDRYLVEHAVYHGEL